MDNRNWQSMYREENDARLAAEGRAELAEQDAVNAEEKVVALLTKLKDMRARAEEAEGGWKLAESARAAGATARELALDALRNVGFVLSGSRWPSETVRDLCNRVVRLAEEVVRERDEARRDAAFRLDRERSIIDACERVADGGQYRADIVGAIERIRRERDEALDRIDVLERRHEEDEAYRQKADDERDEARARAERAERERDDLNRAIEDTLPELRALREAARAEPARIDAAEMARDVAWVRECATSRENGDGHASTITRALRLDCRDAAYGILDVADDDRSAEHDIAAAIRAARGAL